jgi:hypothetical protein
MVNRQPTNSRHLQPQRTDDTVELRLPPPRDSSPNSDRLFRREFLSRLQDAGVGWASQAQANCQGDAFVEALGAVLWTINQQWPALQERLCSPSEYWVLFRDRKLHHHQKVLDVIIDSDAAVKWLDDLESN